MYRTPTPSILRHMPKVMRFMCNYRLFSDYPDCTQLLQLKIVFVFVYGIYSGGKRREKFLKAKVKTKRSLLLSNRHALQLHTTHVRYCVCTRGNYIVVGRTQQTTGNANKKVTLVWLFVRCVSRLCIIETKSATKCNECMCAFVLFLWAQGSYR